MARKFRNDISAETLRSVLDYDPITGIFTRRGGHYAGAVAGGVNGGGYITIIVLGHSYLGHRLAWLHYYGGWPAQLIDHINGDTAFNAIANLREADDIRNQQNAARNGVKFNRRCKARPFRAIITFNKKRIYLGGFATFEEAQAVAQAAKARYFGEFARRVA